MNPEFQNQSSRPSLENKGYQHDPNAVVSVTVDSTGLTLREMLLRAYPSMSQDSVESIVRADTEQRSLREAA